MQRILGSVLLDGTLSQKDGIGCIEEQSRVEKAKGQKFSTFIKIMPAISPTEAHSSTRDYSFESSYETDARY